MKKIVLKSALIFALVFSGCESDNQIEIKSDINLVNKSIENKIGFYHNLALEINFDSFTKDTRPEEIRNQIISTLIEENNEFFNNETILALPIPAHIFENTNLKSSSNEINGYDFSIIFNDLSKKNYITSELAKRLNEINIYIIDKEMSNNEVLKKVNDLDIGNWNKNDRKYVNAYMQVFNSSHEFWTGRNKKKNYSSKNCAQECDLAIIAADAAGALYGMIAGPIMSIIEAAVFSSIAAINDVCDCPTQ